MKRTIASAALLLAVTAGGLVAVSSRPAAAPAAAAEPEWKLRRYTLRGAAVDFFLRHPSVFAKDIGGPPVTVKNETYLRLADLAARFSYRFNKDSFGDSLAESSFLGRGEDERNVPCAAFLGKPFFAGDAHTEAGFFPSPKVSDRDLDQILRAHAGWRLAVSGFKPEEEWGEVIFWRSADSTSLLPAPAQDEQTAKLLKLMNHVAGGRMPFGFLLQCHMLDLGGCVDRVVFGDLALPRYVNLTVAVIENNSDRTLTISGFQGGSNARRALRLSSADDRALKAGAKSLGWTGLYRLKPGERLVAPEKIAFSFDDYEYASPSDYIFEAVGAKPNASEIRGLIQFVKNKPKGLVFRVERKDGKPRTAAMKSSTLSKIAARAWQDPRVGEDFIYGASFRLASFKVGASAAPKIAPKSHSLNYATAEGFGSCPFAYVWDDEKKLWLAKGRVLVGCIGPKKAREEVYDLRTAPTLVAIREKEAEVTHLADVFLEVFDRNGRWRKVMSDRAQETIREGEERIYRFELGEGLKGRPAKLHVRGYYIGQPRITLGVK